MGQAHRRRSEVDLLRDPFNRALLIWLIKGPRSFADVVAAFGLSPAYVREHLHGLIAAGFVHASTAEPLDHARKLSAIRRALRAAGLTQPLRQRSLATAPVTRVTYGHALIISDAAGYGAITGDDV
jgi:hypothetical protein